MEKTEDAFRTISEVAEDLGLPQHVLRFWETRFTQIRPLKRGGGRRYYRREDIALLRAIRELLYGEGYTIKGVQKILKEQGARAVVAAWRGDGAPQPSERPVAAGLPQVAVARTVRETSDTDAGADEDFDIEADERAGVPARREPAFGPVEIEILKMLVTELNECERLLGNARRQSQS